MYKNNSRDSSKFKACSPHQLSCNLTGKCHAIGYYSYTNRYLQGEEMRTVEHKLKILKHIIGKLTCINNFVFADSHKKEAYAHCTHLQIAQADPQTKICKRVQSFPNMFSTFATL